MGGGLRGGGGGDVEVEASWDVEDRVRIRFFCVEGGGRGDVDVEDRVWIPRAPVDMEAKFRLFDVEDGGRGCGGLEGDVDVVASTCLSSGTF